MKIKGCDLIITLIQGVYRASPMFVKVSSKLVGKSVLLEINGIPVSVPLFVAEGGFIAISPYHSDEHTFRSSFSSSLSTVDSTSISRRKRFKHIDTPGDSVDVIENVDIPFECPFCFYPSIFIPSNFESNFLDIIAKILKRSSESDYSILDSFSCIPPGLINVPIPYTVENKQIFEAHEIRKKDILRICKFSVYSLFHIYVVSVDPVTKSRTIIGLWQCDLMKKYIDIVRSSMVRGTRFENDSFLRFIFGSHVDFFRSSSRFAGPSPKESPLLSANSVHLSEFSSKTTSSQTSSADVEPSSPVEIISDTSTTPSTPSTIESHTPSDVGYDWHCLIPMMVPKSLLEVFNNEMTAACALRLDRFQKALSLCTLHEGKNSAQFTVISSRKGTREGCVNIDIYFYKLEDVPMRICVSDIDGTITKSDLKSIFEPMVRKPFHSHIHTMYHKLRDTNSAIVYLTMRSLGWYESTSKLLAKVPRTDSPIVSEKLVYEDSYSKQKKDEKKEKKRLKKEEKTQKRLFRHGIMFESDHLESPRPDPKLSVPKGLPEGAKLLCPVSALSNYTVAKMSWIITLEELFSPFLWEHEKKFLRHKSISDKSSVSPSSGASTPQMHLKSSEGRKSVIRVAIGNADSDKAAYFSGGIVASRVFSINSSSIVESYSKLFDKIEFNYHEALFGLKESILRDLED
ncbi:LIPIN family like protein [Aduncisulcus paluster]|uniref:LIPIN family like protein n=1 Tax=Aduncisulcus paluster TaxID=2918883 RepID=A0ABQ5KKM4_9EUKA|nr:LIPIN family like protein [Aduncisulcus paluster]